MATVQIFVHGMHCNNCKMRVENNLSRIQGIETVDVDLDKETVTLTGDEIDLEKVKSTVENIGYKYEAAS
jgi:copper chaperone CopZ